MKQLKSFLCSRPALFICGLAGALAFAPYFVFPVIWVGFALLAYKNTKATRWGCFCNTFCFGAGIGITGMHWLAYTMTTGDGVYAWLVPFIWVGSAIVFGTYYGIPAYLSAFSKPGWPRWLSFAGWFGVFEWIRGIILTGFPWNVIGNIWNTYLPIFQTVSVIGIYGLGILTILIFTWPKFGRNIKSTLCPIALLALLYGFGAWRLYDAPRDTVWGIKLRLVQPNVPCSLKWDPRAAQRNIAKTIHLTRENSDGITHIIWPETAMPFLLNTEHNERMRLMEAMQQGSILITGAMRSLKNPQKDLANSLFVLDDLTNILAYYDKAHLVPFGEYTPLRGIIPWDKYVPFESDIIAGEGPRTIPIAKAVPAGPMICYEAIFSGEVVDKKQRPQWLINITNDGWYGMSAGPHQHFAMAQTRAVEEGLPLVRAANDGISAVVDAYGRIWGQLGLGEEGVVDSPLPRAIEPPPFAQFGNTLPLILAFGLILISFFRQKNS